MDKDRPTFKTGSLFFFLFNHHHPACKSHHQDAPPPPPLPPPPFSLSSATMVSADTARTAVGILGNIIALIMFLSPVPTFIQICKKGSVEQFSPVPYLATLLNCLLWVIYGLPMVHPHSMLVISINGSGTVIELVFVLLFIYYSQGKDRLKVFAYLLLEIVFSGIVLAVVLTMAHTYDRRTLIVGSLCVVFGAMMYVAPLSIMKLVIKTKSVEYMPLFFSVAAFANGICWTSYALIKFDLFITIPNSIGVILAFVQLVLYATFYKSTQRQIAERKNKGETGMTEIVVLGDSKKSVAPQTEIHEGYDAPISNQVKGRR